MSEVLTNQLSSGMESLTTLDKHENVLLAPIEQFYDMIRRGESDEKIGEFFEANRGAALNVNETLKNGDNCLCLACNKGLESVVKFLVEKGAAAVNASRLTKNSGGGGGSFSTITPTIAITARRQTRATASQAELNANARGDSAISICIKYGFEQIAEYLIDHGVDICGQDFSAAATAATSTEAKAIQADFERSPLQEAIRLNRTRIVEKMLQTMFLRDDIRTIEWVFSKRFEILRQVLLSENLETIKVILPNIIENRRIDGEMLLHILNYLLMKSKIQERKEKVNQILETVMEIGTVDDDSHVQFELYNLDIFVRGFLATLKALFNAVSSDDSRTSILAYRTSLFFFIMRYQKALVNFEQFYPDIDTTFDFFYTKMRDTGENVLKLVEYFIQFYDTLITMNHLHLTSANVTSLLRMEHVKKIDILGEFLIQRSLTPLDLRELARLTIKDSMHTYNLYSITALPVLDQRAKEFLYFV